MPLLYVNPARKLKTKKTKQRGSITRISSSSTKGKKKNPSKKKPAARKKPATTKPKQGKKKMARKKLYGAAAAARKKRLAKMKRKRNPAKRRKGPSTAKRRAAAKKGAATRKRRAAAKRRARRNPPPNRVDAAFAKRRAAAKKGWRKRKAKGAAKKTAPKKRRRRLKRAATVSAAAKRGYGKKSLARAKRSVRAGLRRRGKSREYARRAKSSIMKMNPNGFMGLVKQAVPVAASLYLSRMATGYLSGMLAEKKVKADAGVEKSAAAGLAGMLEVGGFDLAKPLISGVLVYGAHLGTKKVKGLQKHRAGILMGTALNFIDSVVSAFAPDDIKSKFGLGEFYAATGEYMEIGDYVEVGDIPPLESGDYVEVGALEQELGLLEQDLGVEEELGDFADRRLGGTHRGSMLSPVRAKPMLSPVPPRSWTALVGPVGYGAADFAQGIFGK